MKLDDVFTLQFHKALERKALHRLGFSLFDTLSANAESQYNSENFLAVLLFPITARKFNKQFWIS
jgi:hypothetical protein